MSTLAQWGTWAAAVATQEVPPDVLRRAQLQHLSTAGAIRGTAKFKAPEHPQKAAQWASRSCLLDHTDHLLWSQTSPGAVCPTWCDTKGRKATDILATTVVANELGARLGLALGPKAAPWWVFSLTAATVRARQLGLTGSQTGHALAIALAECPTPQASTLAHTQQALASAQCVQAGLEAAESAAQGLKGPTDWLDAADSPFSNACRPNGRRAFTALGKRWLGRSTAYSLQPGDLFSKVAVQGTQEILQRHITAADRRLRADQVERIEIRTHAWSLDSINTALDPAEVCRSAAHQIGLAVLTHDLRAAHFHPDVLAEHATTLQTLADKVVIHHDWAATIQLAHQLRQNMTPIYGDLSLGQLWKSRSKGSGFPPRDQWTKILKARPDRLFQSHQAALSDVDVLSFRYPFSTEVKLFTTRGGWWPERRDTPEGAPGWSWQKTVQGVAEKWGCGQPDDAVKAQALVENLPTGAASTWVRQLSL